MQVIDAIADMHSSRLLRILAMQVVKNLRNPVIS
jgi:hypothetical protein